MLFTTMPLTIGARGIQLRKDSAWFMCARLVMRDTALVAESHLLSQKKERAMAEVACWTDLRGVWVYLVSAYLFCGTKRKPMPMLGLVSSVGSIPMLSNSNCHSPLPAAGDLKL